MPAKKPADRARKASAKRTSTSTSHNGRTTATVAPTITSAAEWGREGRAKQVDGRPLTVPSGKTCLVRLIGSMQEFLTRGSVPNALMPIMQQAVGGKGVDNAELVSLVTGDAERLREMFELIDTVVIEAVMEPPVAPVPQREVTTTEPLITVWEPIPPHERPDDDTLYVDYIDLEDRMFIFNYALSGVSDVEQFREIADEGLDTLRAVQELDESTKRHPSAGQ